MADAEALFAAHQAGLLRYFSRAVGHAESARDLTQDVFVRVIGAPALPGRDDERRAWVFHIARNIALDYHRRQRVRGDQAPPAFERGRAATQDTSFEVGQALRTLDALDRDVFLMREVAGLSYQEIATACELTPDAVRSRIHRARVQLREQLSVPIAARQRAPMRAK
jgi:RNA polymerase sigma-70 factor (ECF subfamily)